jgi:hypothetical protein
MTTITKRIDRAVEWTKWPAAVLAVASLPCSFYAIALGCWSYLSSPIYLFSFFAGLGVVWFASRTDLRKSTITKTMFRWMHDASQYAIATLMLHPVIAIRREQRSPGESRVRWLGKGNWIMLVAPYLIPLSAILFWLLGLLLISPLRSFLLGMGLAVHLLYVLHQWTHGTPELTRLGSRFCWMFLPAANLAMAGVVIAFAVEGFSGASDYLVHWTHMPADAWSALRDRFTDYNPK